MAKILYFQDEKYFVDHTKEMLWRYHHKVDHYETPTQFLERQKEGKVNLSNYDILITDLFLASEIDGMEFVKEHILNKGLKLPVLFLTDLNPANIIDELGIKEPNVLPKMYIGELEDKIRETLKIS